MKMRIKTFLLLFSCIVTLVAQNNAVVPQPTRVQKSQGVFTFSPQTRVSVENEGQQRSAQLFAELFRASAGFSPIVAMREDAANASIRLQTDKNLAPEAYKLTISPERIDISASDDAGFFYAFQTLRQMLPSAIENAFPQSETAWTVPCGVVEDVPRFGYRGLMLDVSRYFIPKETVLKTIETMSALKLNKLHLHLVDDNGWRLEIKRYPRLTEVGSWRVNRSNTPFPARRNPQPGEPTTIGGFYTQDDMREIIAFASERQVEIIPEIEMPAHTVSSLAAYPHLACPVVDKFIGVLPGLGGDMAKVVYCAGNDSVFTFIENVLDEVMALFPSKYIHLGGDEADKHYWEKCPRCQARMKSENIANEEELQGWFMQRVSRYVQSKGREVMGWDELTNSTIPQDAIIYGWQGDGGAALKAAKLGHRFVLTPARTLYLIRYQGPQWFEPATYFGNNTLKDVYDYEPVQPNWDERTKSLLMGVQASLWTEFCASPQDVEYLLFPRLVAFAETAWQAKDRKDWNGFLPRLDAFNKRLEARRVNYATSMYNLDHVVSPAENDALSVQLSCIRPDVEIRYTTNGNPPDASSPLYTQPLTVKGNSVVRANTFHGKQRLGETLTLNLEYNLATSKPISGTNGKTTLATLVNGLRGSLKHSDFEWSGWHNSDVSLTVDLQKKQKINIITIGAITNYGVGVHLPREISIFVSENGKDFRQAVTKKFSDSEIFREGNFIEDQTLPLNGVSARYIRIEAKNPGACPSTHLRNGLPTWIYFDEIVVK